MKGDIVTLYYPGDGVTANSNVVHYKGIKNFKDNGDGTISFKTTKHGDITTPLPWRLKKDAELDEVAEEPAAPAGNQAGRARRGW